MVSSRVLDYGTVKLGSEPQHREAQPPRSPAILLNLGLRSELNEAERGRMCRAEIQTERRSPEKVPEILHTSPLESWTKFHEAG